MAPRCLGSRGVLTQVPLCYGRAQSECTALQTRVSELEKEKERLAEESKAMKSELEPLRNERRSLSKVRQAEWTSSSNAVEGGG